MMLVPLPWNLSIATSCLWMLHLCISEDLMVMDHSAPINPVSKSPITSLRCLTSCYLGAVMKSRLRKSGSDGFPFPMRNRSLYPTHRQNPPGFWAEVDAEQLWGRDCTKEAVPCFPCLKTIVFFVNFNRKNPQTLYG